MLRLSGERASRARLAMLWLILAASGCGSGDVRGEWAGTSDALGDVTLMLDLDGHFELTLARTPGAADARATVNGSAVAYSGRYETNRDTIYLRGIPGAFKAIRTGDELVLTGRGNTIRMRRL